MARANVAGASAHAEADKRTASAIGWSRSLTGGSLASFAHFGVPAMVGIFSATLGLIAFLLALEDRKDTITEVMAEIEMVALTVSTVVDSGASTFVPGQSQLFEKDLPGRVIARGRVVIVTDRNGRIAGTLPQQSANHSTLTEILGHVQLLTTFAEKAGAQRFTMPDGREAIAAVRNLKEPFGQVAVYQTLDAVLADWRAQATRAGLMIACAIILMCIIASAYIWQAGRAHAAAHQRDRISHRMDIALSHGRCGLWEWDIARGRIFFSQSMYEMLGMEVRAEALSIGDVNGLLHPQDGDLNLMAAMLLANELDVVDHLFRIRGPNGGWLWIHARAELDTVRGNGSAYLIGIALDISKQKQLEEQTKTADARLSAAIDTISEAFVLWNSDNRLIICNDKFLNFLSLPENDDYTGLHFDEIMSRAVLPVVGEGIDLREQPQSGARTYEAHVSGNRWFQINERRTADGGYVSVGADITKLKRHEEKLVDSERKLIATVSDLRRSRQTLEIQARQLTELAERYYEQKAEAELASSAKSAFLGNMSHELRTPLNAIIGFSQVMEQETFGALGSKKYLDYTTHIRESGQHLLGIIGDVLEMSTLEAGNVDLIRTQFDLDEVIQRSMQDIEPYVVEKLIEVTIEPHVPVNVSADKDAIEKVLIKLLRNAVKFTPERGSIVLRVAVSGGDVDIFIADSGPGIQPEHLERLGKPFEQINSPLQNGLKGSGLGLAIARSIAELHGGSLQIESELGIGTTICVSLPARAGKVESDHSESSPIEQNNHAAA